MAGKDPAPEESPESLTEDSEVPVLEIPKPGGSLRMGLCMPETLNPLKVSQPEVAQLLMMIFMPLLETDAQGRPSGEGAVSGWGGFPGRISGSFDDPRRFVLA